MEWKPVFALYLYSSEQLNTRTGQISGKEYLNLLNILCLSYMETETSLKERSLNPIIFPLVERNVGIQLSVHHEMYVNTNEKTSMFYAYLRNSSFLKVNNPLWRTRCRIAWKWFLTGRTFSLLPCFILDRFIVFFCRWSEAPCSSSTTSLTRTSGWSTLRRPSVFQMTWPSTTIRSGRWATMRMVIW